MRERWIDNAKAIAIICVIIGHVCTGFENGWQADFVYAFHLVMFFMISGFTSKKRILDLKYVNNKFSRLMVPYFFTCLAVTIMDSINAILIHNNGIKEVSEIIANDILRGFFASGSFENMGPVYMRYRIGAVWFLPAMFFAVIMFQYIINTFENIWVSGGVNLAISIIGFLSARFIWFPFSIQAAMMALPYIWLGYYIKNTNWLDSVKKYYYVLAAAVFAYGMYFKYCNVAFVVAGAADVIISTIVGLAGCLLVYGISKIIHNNQLEYIGKISLYVLAAHLFTLESLWPYVFKAADVLGLSGDVRVIVITIVEIVIAIILGWVIDKITSVKWCENSMYNKVVSFACNSNKYSPLNVGFGCVLIALFIQQLPIGETLYKALASIILVILVLLTGARTNVAKKIYGIGCLILNFVLMISLALSVLYKYGIFENDYSGLGLYNLISFIGNNEVVFDIYVIAVCSVIFWGITTFAKSTKSKLCFGLLLSIIGYELSRQGIRNELFLDSVMYIFIFFILGDVLFKNNVMEKISEAYPVYFVSSCGFFYMLYTNWIHVMYREYKEYGVGIFGLCCGIALFMQVMYYLFYRKNMVSVVLSIVGYLKYMIIFAILMLSIYL